MTPALEITEADLGQIRSVAAGQAVRIGPGLLAAVGGSAPRPRTRWPTGGWCMA